jgi:hypothetical protein
MGMKVRISVYFIFRAEWARGEKRRENLERNPENKLSKLIINYHPRRIRPGRISTEAVKVYSLAFRGTGRKIVS